MAIPPVHSDESADSNSNYGQSNDEGLHLAHSCSPHQLSSGAASDYGKHSCNTVSVPQLPSTTTQYSASPYPGQAHNTSQPSPMAALGYFPPLNFSVTLPQMPAPHTSPFKIAIQPSFGAGNVPQLNISINLPQIPSDVPHSFPTWPRPFQTEYQPPSDPALIQPHDQNNCKLDQIPSGSSLGTSAYAGQAHTNSKWSRLMDTAFGNGHDSSVPTQVFHSGQEQQLASQRLNGGLVYTNEICTSSIGPGQSQSIKLPSFLTSTPIAQDLNPALKRTADEIYPLGSESDSTCRSPTSPSCEDAQGPHKRLKEAHIGSTACVSEERVRSLAAASDCDDLLNETRNDILMLHGARDFRISGNPTFTNIGVNNVTNQSGAHDLKILTKLVSFDAIHDSSVQDPDRRCHPGTRENVLARLQSWVDDPSAEHIVWIHGLPGAGKSSVAQTIIRLCGREKVVASFFFYRSDPSRNDGNRLFTTIAWQLASSIPGFKTCLVDSLARRPDLPMKDVETQFEELIVDAASNLELPPVPVVVIDGVDECTDENLQRRLLRVLGTSIRDRHVPLRFLVLSQPETHIKETVNQFECPTLCIDLDLIDNANHDIERYFNAEFSRIADDRNFDPTWPGHHVIRQLVCNSSGQFVYAVTVIKYVGDEYNCAKTQLDIILGLRKCLSASPFAPLDELYTEILKRQPDQDFLKEVLALLVACSFIDKANLHAHVPTLLNASEEEMRRKLRGMQSLLSFEGGYIDIHHRSFLDFLQDVSQDKSSE